MAIPPLELMQYGENPQNHLKAGILIADNLEQNLASAGFHIKEMKTLLDFGCSNGRLMGWLAKFAEEKDIWGCDVQEDKIVWNKENLHS